MVCPASVCSAQGPRDTPPGPAGRTRSHKAACSGRILSWGNRLTSGSEVFSLSETRTLPLPWSCRKGSLNVPACVCVWSQVRLLHREPGGEKWQRVPHALQRHLRQQRPEAGPHPEADVQAVPHLLQLAREPLPARPVPGGGRFPEGDRCGPEGAAVGTGRAVWRSQPG